jgi:branched-chain amino acid transport system permease protein
MMYFSFMLAVCLGIIGGISIVPLTAVSYSMGVDWVIKGFLAAIVGGISRFQGVVAGGLALGLLESLVAGLTSSGYASIIALAVFIVLLLFRPAGLIGPQKIRA